MCTLYPSLPLLCASTRSHGTAARAPAAHSCATSGAAAARHLLHARQAGKLGRQGLATAWTRAGRLMQGACWSY